MKKETKITEAEFLRRLESLDEDTLNFLAKYSSGRRRLARTSTLVSTLIASVTGLALAVTYVFPYFEFEVVSALSILIGVLSVWFSIWEREREENRLISRLLKESSAPDGPENNVWKKKRDLVEQFLKAEGL